MGNFRILSLGVCQMVNVYSPMSFWTEGSMCAMCGESLLRLNFSLKDLHRCLLIFYSVLTEVSTFDFLMDFSAKLLLQHPYASLYFRATKKLLTTALQLQGAASYPPLTRLASSVGQTEVGVPGKTLTFPPSSR